MSDSDQPGPAIAGDIKFTEKEERVLKVVWACMKNVPEVDLTKLTTAAGFQTQKTCSNTWGVLKKKLMAQAAANGIEVDPAVKLTKPPTKTTPKKRVKSEEGADGIDTEGANGDNGGSPSKPKRARKTPAKKTAAVKAEPDDDEDAAVPGAD